MLTRSKGREPQFSMYGFSDQCRKCRELLTFPGVCASMRLEFDSYLRRENPDSKIWDLSHVLKCGPRSWRTKTAAGSAQ